MMIEPSIQFRIDALKIVPRYDIPQPVWDAFVDTSPQAWLYHTFDMQDAIATWPGKSDLSFALMDDAISGKIVAVMPLHRVEKPFLKIVRNCHLESLGSFALLPGLSPRQVAQVTGLLIELLLKAGIKHQAEQINITLPPLTPVFREGAYPRVNPLIHLGFINQPSQTYLINLCRPKQQIWDNMESYCRTHIRKAEKSGISIRNASSRADLETYFEMHCETYHRTNVKPHPFRYFECIWDRFVSNGRAVIFFAEKNGKVLAADNEGVFKKAMSGWTAAAVNGSTSGVNNLLHWTAIQWAIDHGIEWYESGEGFPGEVSGKRKGLTDFKKSFGGELYPLYRGQIIQRRFIHQFRNLLHTVV